MFPGWGDTAALQGRCWPCWAPWEMTASSWWRVTASQNLLLRRPRPHSIWTGEQVSGVLGGDPGSRCHWAPPPCSLMTVMELHKWLHVSYLGEGGHLLSWPPAGPALSCRFVLLVSGLGLGGGGGESLLGTQLLVDVVTGQLGDEGEQCSAAQVSRVILAGNLLSQSTQTRDSINKVCPRPVLALPPLGWHPAVTLGPPSAWGRVLCSDPAFCPPCGWGFALCSAQHPSRALSVPVS